MAKSKQKRVTVFNTGGRTYSDVYTTPEGKHLDLAPGKSLDLPASVAAFLMTGYPREIVSARPGNAEETKEIASREAAVERREVKAAEREAEIEELAKDIATAGEKAADDNVKISQRTAELEEREKALEESKPDEDDEKYGPVLNEDDGK